MAHAIREHGREKSSNVDMANLAVGLLTIGAGVYGYKHNIDANQAMDVARTAGGIGATLFFLLPNSREMELEADAIGIELAARAGYDANAAVGLWEKMAKDSVRRPEFLSTHPSPSVRIDQMVGLASAASVRFAERRRETTTLVTRESPPTGADLAAARAAPAIGTSMSYRCLLPDGAAVAMALIGCQRLGGKLMGEKR